MVLFLNHQEHLSVIFEAAIQLVEQTSFETNRYEQVLAYTQALLTKLRPNEIRSETQSQFSQDLLTVYESLVQDFGDRSLGQRHRRARLERDTYDHRFRAG